MPGTQMDRDLSELGAEYPSAADWPFYAGPQFYSADAAEQGLDGMAAACYMMSLAGWQPPSDQFQQFQYPFPEDADGTFMGHHVDESYHDMSQEFGEADAQESDEETATWPSGKKRSGKKRRKKRVRYQMGETEQAE